MRSKIRPRTRQSQPSIDATLWRVEMVYYVRHKGYIKIGWTNSLPTRLRKLGVAMTDVMAYEYGPRTLESQRHEEFSHLNVTGDGLGREHFEYAPDLSEHMDSLMMEARSRALGHTQIATPNTP